MLQKAASLVRRAFALALALVLLGSVTSRAHAETIRFQLGERSDDVFRVEMRLSDLGYLSEVVNGSWDQADADALAAFAEATACSW